MKILFKKIYVKSKSVIFLNGVRFALRINSPKLAGIIFSVLAGGRNKNKKFRVLCLGRTIFYDDIAALTSFGCEVQYSSVHLIYFDLLLRHYAKGKDKKFMLQEELYAQEKALSQKKKLYNFLSLMLPVMKKYIGFDAILSGSFCYTQQQEFARVLVDNGVPFIVLHKEAITAPDAYKNFVKHYKPNKFIGSAMLFYNNQCRDGLLDINLSGLTKDNSFVVGIPRFDYYFLGDGSKKYSDKKRKIVFFSFNPETTLRFLPIDKIIMKAIIDKTSQFYGYVVSLAQKYSNIEIIIKTKNAIHYVEYAKKMIAKNGGINLKNIIITNDRDPSEIIKGAEAVLGFNSTTLIEAIINDTLIITPDFQSILKGYDWDFFQKYPQLVQQAQSFEDLENSFFSAHRHLPYDKDQKKRFLEEFISTSHGGASKRTEEYIVKIIKDYNICN